MGRVAPVWIPRASGRWIPFAPRAATRFAAVVLIHSACVASTRCARRVCATAEAFVDVARVAAVLEWLLVDAVPEWAQVPVAGA